MFDFLITVLLVALFVLGLFGLVQWVLSFFPRLNSERLGPPVGKWWLILLGIVFWLDSLIELLNSEGPSTWTKDEYMNIFYLCAATYLIVHVWRSTTQPTRESTQTRVPEDSDTGQP